MLFKNKIFFTISAFSSLLLFSVGCASLTGYQDGKTVGQGNGEAMVSLNISQTPDFGAFEDSLNITDINSFFFPNIELGGRYGATENLDITVRMNTNLNLGVGAKYQIVGDRSSNFAVSVGTEIATFGLISGLWNVQIPVYTSYHPTEKLAIYASPRYIYQFSSVGSFEGFNYLGGNVGLLFGSRHKFGIDLGIYKASATGSGSVGLNSFGIGGKFVFGNNGLGTTTTKTKKSIKKRTN